MFISHNKADTQFSIALAENLVKQGASVWFDQWEIRPGDSIIGGISQGLKKAEVFILVWSENAARSKWVGTEVRGMLRRRVEEESLRIVPIMLDETPLPVLVAEYSGFQVDDKTDVSKIAEEICGYKPNDEIIRILQNRLEQMTGTSEIPGKGSSYYRCPKCGSSNLKGVQSTDDENDSVYYEVRCLDCGWIVAGAM